MVHVADPSFYRAVRERLARCDAVMLEGVPSSSAGALTLTYSLLGYFRRGGLVNQSDESLLREFRGEVLHCDVAGEQFDRSWKALPLHLRAAVALLVPVVALRRLLRPSRADLARGLETDDLTSRSEILRRDDIDAMDDVLLTQRDRHLIRRIADHVQRHHHQRARVAIVYGASHMRAVARYLLHNLGYRIAAAEWLTVLDLIDPETDQPASR